MRCSRSSVRDQCYGLYAQGPEHSVDAWVSQGLVGDRSSLLRVDVLLNDLCHPKIVEARAGSLYRLRSGVFPRVTTCPDDLDHLVRGHDVLLSTTMAPAQAAGGASRRPSLLVLLLCSCYSRPAGGPRRPMATVLLRAGGAQNGGFPVSSLAAPWHAGKPLFCGHQRGRRYQHADTLAARRAFGFPRCPERGSPPGSLTGVDGLIL